MYSVLGLISGAEKPHESNGLSLLEYSPRVEFTGPLWSLVFRQFFAVCCFYLRECSVSCLATHRECVATVAHSSPASPPVLLFDKSFPFRLVFVHTFTLLQQLNSTLLFRNIKARFWKLYQRYTRFSWRRRILMCALARLNPQLSPRVALNRGFKCLFLGFWCIQGTTWSRATWVVELWIA